jgi:hypothetical protein
MTVSLTKIVNGRVPHASIFRSVGILIIPNRNRLHHATLLSSARAIPVVLEQLGSS